MSDPCSGCLQKSKDCDLIGYNVIMDECPCGSCLVKVTCVEVCAGWFDFLQNYKEWFIEEYDEELES